MKSQTQNRDLSKYALYCTDIELLHVIRMRVFVLRYSLRSRRLVWAREGVVEETPAQMAMPVMCFRPLRVIDVL
jgi:hypothetical protein